MRSPTSNDTDYYIPEYTFCMCQLLSIYDLVITPNFIITCWSGNKQFKTCLSQRRVHNLLYARIAISVLISKLFFFARRRIECLIGKIHQNVPLSVQETWFLWLLLANTLSKRKFIASLSIQHLVFYFYFSLSRDTLKKMSNICKS